MKRVTITFPDELHKKIQRLRGSQIAETGKGLPFSQIIVQLVEEALKKMKKGSLK